MVLVFGATITLCNFSDGILILPKIKVRQIGLLFNGLPPLMMTMPFRLVGKDFCKEALETFYCRCQTSTLPLEAVWSPDFFIWPISFCASVGPISQQCQFFN
jgi:hypothetical protein